jgi:hypothetical protein
MKNLQLNNQMNLDYLAGMLETSSAPAVSGKRIVAILKKNRNLYLGMGRGINKANSTMTVYLELTDGRVYETGDMTFDQANKVYRKLNKAI